jgi:hypothetical protein
MASCSISAKEAEAENTVTVVPNWLALPKEITTNILQRLHTIEIVKSVCLVCPLWWNICKDRLMWRTIRMTNLLDKNPLSTQFPPSTSQEFGIG